MDEIKSSRTPATKCPGCGKILDATTGIGTPEPGDFSICAYCRTWLIYKDDLTMRLVTTEDLEKLPPDHLAILKRLTKEMPHIVGS
jgi:hypothetical protein